MIEISDGLFICNKLNQYNETTAKKYCKVIAVSVHSTNIKTKKNLIAYKIGFWDEEPKTALDFSQFKVYRSSSHGKIIHTFEIDRKLLNRDELISLCTKHFMEVALFDYTPKHLCDEVCKLTEITSRQFIKSKTLPGKMAIVWDVCHKTRYETTNGQIPELVENVLKYKGDFLEGNEKVFNWNFGDNNICFETEWSNSLSEKALAHLDTQETIDFCNVNF